MAITYSLGLLLARTIRDQHIGGSLLQLGRQGVYMNDFQLSALLKQFGFADFTGPAPGVRNPDFLLDCDKAGAYHRVLSGIQTINDAAFFRLMGLESFSSDANAYEDCDYLMDLNAGPAADLAGKQFDAVLDGGTVEHVFHLPNALANVHRLLKTGGCVIHVGVANGNVDHGFYQISPCFFLEYYEANGYEILESKLMTNDNDIHAPRFVCEHYSNIAGIPPERQYLYYIVARKLPGARCGVVPTQKFYAQSQWGGGGGSCISPLTRFRLERLSAGARPGQVAVWCATHVAEELLADIPALKAAVTCIVDRDPAKQGKSMQGVEIISPERFLSGLDGVDHVVIASMGPVSIYNDLSRNPALKPKLVML